MKRAFIIIALVAVLAIAGCAKEAEASGGGDPCDGFLAGILNQCVEHPSEDKEVMPIGVGLDLILYESDVKDITYKITSEYKYDVRNSEQSLFAVVTLKLQDIINKIKGE